MHRPETYIGKINYIRITIVDFARKEVMLSFRMNSTRSTMNPTSSPPFLKLYQNYQNTKYD